MTLKDGQVWVDSTLYTNLQRLSLSPVSMDGSLPDGISNSECSHAKAISEGRICKGYIIGVPG